MVKILLENFLIRVTAKEGSSPEDKINLLNNLANFDYFSE